MWRSSPARRGPGSWCGCQAARSGEARRGKQIIFGALYYGLAQWLPASRRMGGLPGWLRYHCCRNIFASCGKGVNIERRVYFGGGSTIRVGDGSGIGVAAKLAPCVTIGRNVLMGEDVLFLTQNHAYKNAGELIGKQGYTGRGDHCGGRRMDRHESDHSPRCKYWHRRCRGGRRGGDEVGRSLRCGGWKSGPRDRAAGIGSCLRHSRSCHSTPIGPAILGRCCSRSPYRYQSMCPASSGMRADACQGMTRGVKSLAGRAAGSIAWKVYVPAVVAVPVPRVSGSVMSA